jgi:phage replication O-like protein O
MADVQLEHGHVRIANRLFEAILDADFTGAQSRILVALIRLTYGWRRRTVTLTVPELAAYCRMQPVGGFRRALRDLVGEGVVIQLEHDRGRSATTYAIQKDFMAWGRYSVAEARLTAVWQSRPQSDDDLLSEGVTPQGQTPQGDNPTGSYGTTPQGHPVQPHRVIHTGSNPLQGVELDPRKDSERQGKDKVVVSRDDAITRFVVMANKGLSEHPAHPQMIPRILVGQPSAGEATDSILAAGIPVEFAESAIYELAKTHGGKPPIGSLKYFDAAVQRRWAETQAATAAAATSAPRALPTAPDAPPVSRIGVGGRAYLTTLAALEDEP